MLTELGRYHVELVHDEVRLRTFWVMCERVVDESVIEAMVPGILDTCDQFISTPPLMFIQVEQMPLFGRISRRAVFLRPSHVRGLPDVFVTNSEFWGMFDDHNFYAQLTKLGHILAGDFQSAIAELEKTFNLHIIGV